MKNLLKIFLFLTLLSSALSLSYAKEADVKVPDGKIIPTQNNSQINSMAQPSEVIASSGVMNINTKDKKQADLIQKIRKLAKEREKLKTEGKTKEALAKSKEIEQTKDQLKKITNPAG